MNASELIQRLQQVPYAPGAGDWSGIDCWGVVEIWYRERFGIDLSDRGDIRPGASGLSEGFEVATDWLPVDHPQNDDLVVMRHFSKRLNCAFEHGHIGVFWNNGVIHALDKSTGCIWQPIKARQVANRVTCFLRHRSLA